MILFPTIPSRLLLKITVAATVLALAAAVLASCTVCPDRQCPTFPDAAPGQ